MVGCVDGTHISIPQFQGDNSFFNRKGYPSILLQGICDSNYYFTDIYFGWPGCVNDARIWRDSPLYERLVIDTENTILPDAHLFGDKAYPLDTFLMVPFRNNGHLTQDQVKYKTILSRRVLSLKKRLGS